MSIVIFMAQKGYAAAYLLIISAFLGLLFVESNSNHKPNPTPKVVPQVQENKPKVSTITQEQLQKYLTVEAALLGVSDNISLYFKDINQGKEVSIEPTRSWIPASTIKSYVVLEAFRQKSLGLIDFNQTITIKAENVVPTELETDEFPRLREGTKATIKQLVEAMIIQSDNTAYNTLLDILDRRNINLALKNIGITETVIGEKLNLDEYQFQIDLQVPGRQPNTTTVKDLATYFELLVNKKIVNADEILDIFKRQKLNNMIPAYLPQDTVIAHKTGDWAPIYNDAGIVFKPSEPFVLSIFTNSDNPNVVAQLAKVAYFQTSSAVGKLPSSNNTSVSKAPSRIYLSEQPTNSSVLAAETPEKFPEISASDLGITQKDLNVNPQQAKDFLGAIITPGSLFYNVKKFFENSLVKNSKDNSSLTRTYLGLSKSRLSEAKSLIGSGDFKTADEVLNESEKNLEKATELAKNDPNKDLLLLEIRKVNDLHYAILAERAQNIPDSQKDQFINNVYNFYQQNHQKVAPIINTSIAANPTQQKPAVGTITEIKNNQATIQFDDGSNKQMIIPTDTKVRNFQEDTYTFTNTIKSGDKIAVIGLTNSESKIIPQFILENIPKELPQRHQGTVIEIKPDENTMKILDKKGQEEIIKVNLNTMIKSKDTSVSLEGIKAGSQVSIFGTVNSQTSPIPSSAPSYTPTNNSPAPTSSATTNSIKLINSPSPSPTSSSNSTKPTKTPITTGTPASTSAPATKQINATQTVNIQATTITITQNSSGKQEKVETKQPQPSKSEPSKKDESKKEEPKKAPEPPKQPEPAKPKSSAK